jgi:hypothetical protein
MDGPKRLCILLICAAAIAYGTAIYFHTRTPVVSPEQAAAQRSEAQKRWLAIFSGSPKQAFQGLENAHLLMSCFKEGELTEKVQGLFATSHWKDKYWDGKGADRVEVVEYCWMFTVEKPHHPDETGFIVAVRVKGQPPVVEKVSGNVSVD